MSLDQPKFHKDLEGHGRWPGVNGKKLQAGDVSQRILSPRTSAQEPLLIPGHQGAWSKVASLFPAAQRGRGGRNREEKTNTGAGARIWAGGQRRRGQQGDRCGGERSSPSGAVGSGDRQARSPGLGEGSISFAAAAAAASEILQLRQW